MRLTIWTSWSSSSCNRPCPAAICAGEGRDSRNFIRLLISSSLPLFLLAVFLGPAGRLRAVTELCPHWSLQTTGRSLPFAGPSCREGLQPPSHLNLGYNNAQAIWRVQECTNDIFMAQVKELMAKGPVLDMILKNKEEELIGNAKVGSALVAVTVRWLSSGFWGREQGERQDRNLGFRRTSFGLFKDPLVIQSWGEKVQSCWLAFKDHFHA